MVKMSVCDHSNLVRIKEDLFFDFSLFCRPKTLGAFFIA